MNLENLLRKGKRFARNTLLAAGLALSTALVYSCDSGGSSNKENGSDSTTQNPDDGNPTTPPNPTPSTTEPHVMTPQETENISSVQSDRLVFSQPVDYLATGSIVASDINPMTPNGLLRKVTSVSPDKKTFYTQEAKLIEAIADGELVFRGNISNSIYSNQENTLTNPQNNLVALGYTIPNDFVLFDADGNQGTTYDQIIANGSVNFFSTIDFRLAIRNRTLESLLFQETSTENTTLAISALNSLSNINHEVQIYEFSEIPSITLGYLPTPLGIPLPVVVKPVVELLGKLSGSISPLETSVTQNATLIAGFEYQNEIFVPLNHFSNDFTFVPPDMPDISNAEASLGLRVKFLLYGVAGPYGEGDAYLGIDATDLSWRLSGGLRGIVGIWGEIFGTSLGDYSETVFDGSEILAEQTIQPTTITIQPGTDGKDAFVQNSTFPGSQIPSTNYNTNLLEANSGSYVKEALIQFPLSLIQSGSTILSADLYLHGHCTSNFVIPTVTVNIKKILGSWNESSVTWNSKPAYDSVIVSTIEFPETGIDSWQKFDVKNLMQSWMNGTPNYGLALLLGDNESGCTFKSSEYSTSSLRPKLIVSYY